MARKKTSLSREEQLAIAVEALSEHVVLFDAQDRIVLANKVWRELNKEIAEFSKPGTLFDDHLRALTEKGLVSEAIGREEAWRRERMDQHLNPTGPIEVTREDGRWMRMREQRLSNNGTILLISDITETKETEEQLVLAHENAEIANRSKSEFLANMSHELRTPLNAVIGFSEALQTGIYGPVSEQQKERIGDIHGSAIYLLDLINDILDLSKVEAGKIDLNFVEVDVERTIESSLRLIAGRAKEAEIRLSTALPPDLPNLCADERILKQMLTNLLSNAVKFTPPGGDVVVSVSRPDDGGMWIEVRDTGIGIAKSDIPAAIECFGQVANVLTRNRKGTGLGLPLVNKFMELHRGAFEIESELAVGTVARLLFPAKVEQPISADVSKGPLSGLG
jgi:signal transduction histidine kinase